MPPVQCQVSDTFGMCPPDPFQTFSPSLWIVTGLTHPAAKSNWVLQVGIAATGLEDEERGVAGGTPYSVASVSSSSSNSFANIDFMQELLDEGGKKEILEEIRGWETLFGLNGIYPNDVLKGMKELCYQKHLYRYKKNESNVKYFILWWSNPFNHEPPPSLPESSINNVESKTISTTLDTSEKEPTSGMGKLVDLHQLCKMLQRQLHLWLSNKFLNHPQVLAATSNSSTISDCNGVSEAGGQGGVSASTTKNRSVM